MNILNLTLKKNWFDEILSENKKIEYREIKPYWIKRLEGKTFNEIYFRNGYSKSSPFMRVEWKGMTKGQSLYQIHLGKILEVKNYKWTKQ